MAGRLAQAWHTERLHLRPYVDADAPAAHALLDTDPKVWRFDPGHARDLAARRETIQRYGHLWRQFGFGPAAAFEARTGALVGQGGLNPYLFEHRYGTQTVEVEVMFKLGRGHWGQGYATEIARFWADFAFAELRLARLISCPAAANVASIAVLERLGCAIEPDWLEPDTVIATLTPDRLHVSKGSKSES